MDRLLGPCPGGLLDDSRFEYVVDRDRMLCARGRASDALGLGVGPAAPGRLERRRNHNAAEYGFVGDRSGNGAAAGLQNSAICCRIVLDWSEWGDPVRTRHRCQLGNRSVASVRSYLG